MKKKKEIWIVNHYATPPGYGGLTRHYYLAKYLQKSGYDVKIFASSAIHNSTVNFISDSKCIYKENIIDDVKYIHVKTSQYEGNKFGRINNIIEFWFRCKKVMKIYYKKNKPNFIYSSSPHPLSPLIANNFAKKKRIENIVETRDLWPETMISFGMLSKKSLVAKVLLYIQKKIYLNTDKLVFTMEGAEEYLKTLPYYNKLGKVYWLNNGVDFKNYSKLISFKDSDLDDKKTFKVVYTGSIRYAYHIESILDVAQQIKKKKLPIKFLIYGKGPYLEELKKYCSDKKIDNVVFKGFVDEKYLPYILSKIDICLLHGKNHSVFKYGTSQNKMFTYLAGGKPIISTFINDYDLISRYNCGISLNETNLKKYVDSILYFYNLSKKDYEMYCKNSLKLIKDFDYKVLADKLRKILED